jgi:hypothetical protein
MGLACERAPGGLAQIAALAGQARALILPSTVVVISASRPPWRVA